jgi:hypothetical protein
MGPVISQFGKVRSAEFMNKSNGENDKMPQRSFRGFFRAIPLVEPSTKGEYDHSGEGIVA